MPRTPLRTPASWRSPLNSARREVLRFPSDEARVRSFGHALDQLRAQLTREGWSKGARLTSDERARWYISQLERFRNIELRGALRFLNRTLSHRAETHIFGGLSRSELSRIAPRVSSVCYVHGVRYRSHQISAVFPSDAGSKLVAVARHWLRKLGAR